MRETFYLDGVDALSAGIELQAPIEFSEPIPIVETDLIDGRNGELIYETGSYENRTATASCFALKENVLTAMNTVNRFLMSKHGYRRLETSDAPDSFWLARVANGARVEQRMRTMSPFEIEFSCKPQRFLKVGEDSISFNAPGSIYNQYFYDAKPFVTIYGIGSGKVYIGGNIIDILSMDGVLYVDSETLNAYNEKGNQNRNVKINNFPVLKDGENLIAFDGNIASVTIKPRWWVL